MYSRTIIGYSLKALARVRNVEAREKQALNLLVLTEALKDRQEAFSALKNSAKNPWPCIALPQY